MALGLGTGSTTKYAVTRIGQLWQAGTLTDITAVPTSEGTAMLARSYGIPLVTLYEQPLLDLVIDGADEVDPQLDLIKGLGGALLREKMVESAAKRFVVVVDDTKIVDKLGTHVPLPVEVAQFGWRVQARWLETLGCAALIRGGEEEPYVTDNGNFILDCAFPHGIDDPAAMAATLRDRVGVIEHGLFLDMASEIIVAAQDGIRVIGRG